MDAFVFGNCIVLKNVHDYNIDGPFLTDYERSQVRFSRASVCFTNVATHLQTALSTVKGSAGGSMYNRACVVINKLAVSHTQDSSSTKCLFSKIESFPLNTN